MDIESLMQRMHAVTDENEKIQIESLIKKEFNTLSDIEKEIVRKEFCALWQKKIDHTAQILNEINIAQEIEEISKYLSLSRIAKDYFGKSREWLYQRIKGYNVNGKPAKFTDSERIKLSQVLADLSRKIKETSIRISS
ncbi:DUF5053 domain-containing protein [Parabacteroides sp. Marseille-P3160]|uniref:DUF5053 domain-containing protein n=1 Tax=Parabacteroides sp. Marseille-P3160 TaxID=1917887 RepID=UPI0009BAE4CD|nr:DUF5053 domain-containing protein [Parabacteroides sp. Marseille-P3160]